MNEFTRVIRYSWVLKRYYLSIAAFVIVIAVLAQLDPFLIKAIIDNLGRIGTDNPATFSDYALIIVAIFAIGILTAFLSNIQGFLGDRLGARLNTFLSQSYYDHVLTLPMQYYDNQVAGRVTSQLERSIVTVSQLMNTFANNFIGMILTVLISLSIIAFYAWPVALLLVLLIPFYIWLTALSSKRWQAHQEVINKEIDANNGRFTETLGQIRAVKSFVQEVAESTFFAKRRFNIEAETKTQSRTWHAYDVARRSGLALVFAGIYSYIAWQATKGNLTIGEVVLLLQFITAAQWPLSGASYIIDALQRAQAGSKSYFEVMDTTSDIQDVPDAKELKGGAGLVSFNDVSFAYDENANVLDGLNFDIKPGTKVALVGESGQGKTTISNMLLRFYEPKSGSIQIDGQDINSVTQSSLRKRIGVVFQEPALFSGTVRDNVKYGTPDATDEEMIAAATAANADEFIQKLPHGYNTEIGERGVKLSGGQKQRLAIARAIVKNPPILILDEATSSLDSRSEHEVQLALNELMRGRTTLIIAHRLSTIASVDNIIGLSNGRVAESGTPAELAKTGGMYAQLLELQQPTAANKAKLKQFDLNR